MRPAAGSATRRRAGDEPQAEQRPGSPDRFGPDQDQERESPSRQAPARSTCDRKKPGKIGASPRSASLEVFHSSSFRFVQSIRTSVSHDRIEADVRLVGEEDEREQELGEVFAQRVRRHPQVRQQGQVGRLANQIGRHAPAAGRLRPPRAQRASRQLRAEAAASSQVQQEQARHRHRHQAAAEVVEDLPPRQPADRIADSARRIASTDRRQQPPARSASRRASSGAAG